MKLEIQENLEMIQDKLVLLNDWHTDVNLWRVKIDLQLEWLIWAMKAILVALITLVLKAVLE